MKNTEVYNDSKDVHDLASELLPISSQSQSWVHLQTNSVSLKENICEKSDIKSTKIVQKKLPEKIEPVKVFSDDEYDNNVVAGSSEYSKKPIQFGRAKAGIFIIIYSG